MGIINLLLMIILFCLPIFVLMFLLQKQRKTTSFPPGPPGLPVIGNLHQYDTSNPPRYLWKLSKQYGPIICLRLGILPTIVISSAKLAKEAMKTQDLQFSCRPTMLGVKTLTFNFIDVGFTPYSSYWRDIKKVCVIHLFSANRVKQFRHVREDEVSRMISKISSTASKPINLNQITTSLSCNIICRVAFSKRSENENENGETSRFLNLLTAAEAMLGGFFFSDYFPSLGWIDSLTGMNRLLKKTFKEADNFCQELIDEHLDPKRQIVDQQKDIIDVLLELQKDTDIKPDLTWDHIKAVLMDVFVAGANTSAASLVWSMTNLMRNPAAMKKAQEEVRSVIKDKGFVDEDDLEGLEYLKAVVKESLRLHPPIAIIPRATTEKCIIDGYEIPAKTNVYVNAWAVGRDAQVWDKPEEFIPERFIGNGIDVRGQHFELVPFGSGRRICPGISMAMPTMELALANLLYKFNWEMPHGLKIDDLDFDVVPGLTVRKKNALNLIPTHFL